MTLPSSEIRTSDRESSLNPRYLNPEFKDCECSIQIDLGDDAENFHETLIALNGPRPLNAMAELLELLTGHYPTVTDEINLERYVAQHNWVDPVAVNEIADCLRVFNYSRIEIDWLSRVARGEIDPSPDMTNGASKRILEGIQGKCSWAS
jgi:hypothetical protein